MAVNIGPFRFLPERRVVICTDCRFGYTADGAKAHLATGPHGMVLEQQHAVAEQVGLLPGILQRQTDLKGFRFPPPECAENPLL